jgi:hypothetical protein
VAFYSSDLGLGPERAFNASAVGARDRCLRVVDDKTGAAVGGRHCGLHDPASGSPLVATAELTVDLALYGVVAYPLRTGSAPPRSAGRTRS